MTYSTPSSFHGSAAGPWRTARHLIGWPLTTSVSSSAADADDFLLATSPSGPVATLPVHSFAPPKRKASHVQDGSRGGDRGGRSGGLLDARPARLRRGVRARRQGPAATARDHAGPDRPRRGGDGAGGLW